MASQAEDDTTVVMNLMRVKVLYSFDELSKTGCLARLPTAVNVPTAFVDGTGQIGAVELRLCLQAIVAASPELVAKLGQDYTVYAYDYSEEENPLVGHGMLSWVLSSPSSDDKDELDGPKNLITGRVLRTAVNLFTAGTANTLEVKLKLVPVPGCLQSEYLDTLERYDTLHKVKKSGNSDVGLQYTAETAHRQHDLAMQPEAGIHNTSSTYLHPVLGAANPRLQSITGTISSIGTPNIALVQSPTAEELDNQPSKKRAKLASTDWDSSLAFGYDPESLRVTASTAASIRGYRPSKTRDMPESAFSDPTIKPPTPRPARKSSVTPRHTKPSGTSRQSALSMSIDNYRVDSTSPTGQGHSIGEVDGKLKLYGQREQLSFENAMESSPEGTTTDIPSSPPVMPHAFRSLESSSPALTRSQKFVDSGFMSSASYMDAGQRMQRVDETIFPTTDANQHRMPSMSEGEFVRPVKSGLTAKPTQGRKFMEEVPGPPELLPKTILPRNPNYRAPRSSVSSLPYPNRRQSSLPPENRLSSADALNLRSDPGKLSEDAAMRSDGPVPPKKPLRRCGSDAGLRLPPIPITQQARSGLSFATEAPGSQAQGRAQDSQPQAQVVGSQDEDENSLSKRKSGSGAKRRKAIEKRLADSVAEGTMPPYCMNCGAIETPTWRRAIARTILGSPRNFEPSEADGEILTCEILERGDCGEPTKFRAITKFMGVDSRSGIELLQFCNPCGLYLNKMKSMRPPEMWLKSCDEALKRRGPYKRKRRTGSEVGICSDNFPESQIHDSMPKTSQVREAQHDAEEAIIAGNQPKKARSASLQPEPGTGNAHNRQPFAKISQAVVRAVQSSPIRRFGTEDRPIELDAHVTPKPTRRLLFPSPRQSGEFKSLTDKPPQAGQDTNDSHAARSSPSGQTVVASDKENVPPDELDVLDPDFEHLFDDKSEPALFQLTPQKGSSFLDLLGTPKSRLQLLKTPASRRSHSSVTRRHSVGHNSPSKSGKGQSSDPKMTPFTAEMHHLLSEAPEMDSPSKYLNLSGIPLLASPKHSAGAFNFDVDVFQDPMARSLPGASSANDLFSLYVNPIGNVGVNWETSSIFDNPKFQGS